MSHKKNYGRSFKADLLEQYKLYVQSADNVSARRVSSNRYLLTVNVAICALYGYQGLTLSLIPITIVGMLLSYLTWRIIKSHLDLNSIKFKIIHELEQHFPVALYDYEWKLAEEGRGKTYRLISNIELTISIVFLLLHFIILIIILCINLGNYIFTAP